MDKAVKARIDKLILDNPVILFMKGSKDNPQCGFSKQALHILSSLSDVSVVDVLADMELREGIKAYSSWPTIPQLYINGQFIGGCDIINELYQKRELHHLLGLVKAIAKPHINLSEKAKQALAQADKDDHDIRLHLSYKWEYSLSLAKPDKDDFIFNYDGFNIIIDPYSAYRLNNIVISYEHHDDDSGFTFTNPNEPPKVEDLSVMELNNWYHEHKDMLLIDVRPQHECLKARIAFAKPLYDIALSDIHSWPKDKVLVFHCHHGYRSHKEAEKFRLNGFLKVYNLSGGIDAWSKNIDQSIPLY